jgi:NitT/TauT family transport system permease protein
VRTIAPVYFKTARVLRLSRGQLIMRVVMPAAVPELVSGLRVGFSLTLLGVLIGEMFASQRGLGYLVMNAIGTLDVPTMMAVVLMLAIVAVIISATLLYLDRRLHDRAS